MAKTVRKYIPDKGDIVWIDFDPSAGHEINKRRPGLVVSRRNFNLATQFAVVCPITSTLKDLPTRYQLPGALTTKGQIVISQLKSLDFNHRRITFIEKLPANDLLVIDQMLKFIFF
ncbi:PemK family transcriptional regulator [Aerococcus urinaehominis]|uniref:PemK family transcriptional regulator n=1 Tax=Aerococcus urinaehominis TaxID=128944 RepID=A0A109RG51_9LACT|nr:type II toxin-antitoxin system PemK/MazF family toxin [Aerococcus urinaehominis]AMB98591.1 PemK family transcriptional regulator [Aerococcus urinaehominis]SDL76607.1 mRNA interferase MazF [Aerococcus urinaehominis]